MIKITADSTCDLPAELLRQHHISIAPLGIAMGEQFYQDGINIQTRDIAAHVDAGGKIATTNAVNTADYIALFRRELRDDDSNALIHITIGSNFSSCYQNACLAAEEVPNVFIVNSENLSAGHGFLVLAAAEAAEAGKSVPEILALLENLIPRVEISFVLDRLDYMKKGGRCSAVTALGANLLKLHPCIEVIQGKMSVVKKYRGSMEKVIAEYVRERLTRRSGSEPDLNINTDRMILVDTCRTPGLREIAQSCLEADGRFDQDRILEANAGCTIFCHCGPDTLGLVFLRKS